MEGLANHYRERAVACLMLRDAQPALLDYAPQGEVEGLRARLADFAAIPEAERAEAVAEHLAGIRTAEEVVMLCEVHPSWLVDILVRESPRVIGIVLRFLPSRHARYVMQHLPAPLRAQLPHVVDAFGVSDPVLRIVRHYFESHFIPVRPAQHCEQLDFATLQVLSLDDVDRVIHDVGIDEMALAFRAVARSALRVVLNRLPFADAKALTERIASLQQVDPLLEREARFAILELSFEQTGADMVLREIGIQALAKAIQPAQLPMVGILKQKLAPRLAYLLQRDIDTFVPAQHPQLVPLRQQRILTRIARLSQRGLIDQAWFAKLPAAIRTASTDRGDDTSILVSATERDRGVGARSSTG